DHRPVTVETLNIAPIPSGYDLGQLLLGFLQLYGTRFDYEKIVIRITEGGFVVFPPSHFYFRLFFVSSHTLLPVPTSPALMLVDPFEETNNIGHASFLVRLSSPTMLPNLRLCLFILFSLLRFGL